jgi:hypothetical protein
VIPDWEGVDLRVALAERDVGDLFRRYRAVCPFQHRLGQIDPDGVPPGRPTRGHPGGPTLRSCKP